MNLHALIESLWMHHRPLVSVSSWSEDELEKLFLVARRPKATLVLVGLETWDLHVESG